MQAHSSECVICGKLIFSPACRKRLYCSRTCYYAKPRLKLSDRLWNNVDKLSSSNGCWLWTGGVGSHGYGMICYTEIGDVLTHRLSWMLCRGEIKDGLHVLHNCPGGDNRRCVNPDHLFLGTQDDNAKDMGRKLRAWSKLSVDEVREIKRLHAAYKYTYVKLGQMFGVHPSDIGMLIRGKIWGHVTSSTEPPSIEQGCLFPFD